MSSKKTYVIVVGGKMTKDGKVKPYGTEVVDGVDIDNARQLEEDGFLMSKEDFDEAFPKAEVKVEETVNNKQKGNGNNKPLI